MPLSQDEKQELLKDILSTTGCPVTAQDRLQAYGIGVQNAVEAIVDKVSVDEKPPRRPGVDFTQEDVGQMKERQDAARSVQSEQPAGNGQELDRQPS